MHYPFTIKIENADEIWVNGNTKDSTDEPQTPDKYIFLKSEPKMEDIIADILLMRANL